MIRLLPPMSQRPDECISDAECLRRARARRDAESREAYRIAYEAYRLEAKAQQVKQAADRKRAKARYRERQARGRG